MDRELGGIEYSVGTVERDELPLVVETWLRSGRANPDALRMPKAAYYAWQRGNIDALLTRGATVLVARDVESPVYAYGWLCAERVADAVCVHFAYCKRDWRQRGVARALLDEAVERLGSGASELQYSHGAEVRRGGKTDQRWLTRRLDEAGFARVSVADVLRGGKVAA